MPDDLYDRDILEWSARQADLLRRLAATEPHGAVDWAHVIEEIEAVGTAQLNDARGLLRQAIICLVRMHLDRDAAARPAAALELDCVLDDAAEQVTPSMKDRIDLDLIWSRIRGRAVSGDPLGQALPDHCPWTVDALLANDQDALLAALAGWPISPILP
jgi:Domain of unknown function DUF29